MIKLKHVALTAICLIAIASPAAASETSLTFDAWAEYSNGWTTVTNADGWILHNGQIHATRGWTVAYSLPLSGWLCDHEYSADSWIMSPLLTGGVGRVS